MNKINKNNFYINSTRVSKAIRPHSAYAVSAVQELNRLLLRIAELEADKERLIADAAIISGKFNKRIAELQAQVDLCESALETLSCLGNEPYPGNSDGNIIAQQALLAIKGEGDG